MQFQKYGIGALVALLVASGAAAQQGTSPTAAIDAATVVAKVNGIVLSKAQLDLALRLSGLPDNEAARAALKNELIAGELVRQAAQKANYAERPEVRQAMEMAKIKAASQLYLRDNVRAARVSEEQVKARYDAFITSAGDKEFKPRVISVKDDATAQAVLAELGRGRAFDQLARQYSDAPNKAIGGEMGWISFKTPAQEGQTQGIPLALAQALTKLAAGGIAKDPVVIGDSRLVVKLDDVRPVQIPAYDAIKDQLRQQLEAAEMTKATAAMVDKLATAASIER
ncbi:MAG: peptidyl-prolyl cis-trans isomerase [Moraxellaceae bacterium]|nr:peptidyl-prolyl cis-trans isomerase [Moraxellaceae bacterium]